MRTLVSVFCVASFFSGTASAVTLPWFRTRPKPVIIEQSQPVEAQPVSVKRVAYYGKPAYPAAGRLYFPPAARVRPASKPAKAAVPQK